MCLDPGIGGTMSSSWIILRASGTQVTFSITARVLQALTWSAVPFKIYLSFRFYFLLSLFFIKIALLSIKYLLIDDSVSTKSVGKAELCGHEETPHPP